MTRYITAPGTTFVWRMSGDGQCWARSKIDTDKNRKWFKTNALTAKDFNSLQDTWSGMKLFFHCDEHGNILQEQGQ